MLQVSEIYRTILGESLAAGYPCVLVRLTGCHLRCTYCDTAHAFQGGQPLTVDQVCTAVTELGSVTVLVTGGEPLLQEKVVPLLAALVANGHRVILETSGTRAAVPLAAVPLEVQRIVDVKTPGSGVEDDQIDWSGIAGLRATDELKFVCCDRRDYEWARDLVLSSDHLPPRTPVSFSPVHGELEPGQLADWILADGLEVRVQIQLHKALWPDRHRGV